MVPELTDLVRERWGELFGGQPAPRALRYLAVSGSVEGGTVTLLAFGDRAAAPLFAAKVHRDPEAEARALAERDLLRELHGADPQLAASTPRVLLCERLGGSWVLAQTILAGRPLSAALATGPGGASDAAAPLDMVADWLAHLYRITHRPGGGDEALRRARVDVELFADTFELSGEERAALEAIAGDLGHLARYGPCVQHGDLVPENILLAPGPAINVIDWTDSTREGFPLHDLLLLLAVSSQHGLGGGDAFAATFFHDTPARRLALACLARHCRQLAIGPDDLSLLLGLFIVRQTVFEYTRVLRASQRVALSAATIQRAAPGSDFQQAIRQQPWRERFRAFAAWHGSEGAGALAPAW